MQISNNLKQCLALAKRASKLQRTIREARPPVLPTPYYSGVRQLMPKQALMLADHLGVSVEDDKFFTLLHQEFKSLFRSFAETGGQTLRQQFDYMLEPYREQRK